MRETIKFIIMKVVCIENLHRIEYTHRSGKMHNVLIKIGEVYEVVGEDHELSYFYNIKYLGGTRYIPKGLFITLEEYREKQLNVLLNTLNKVQ